MSATYNTSMHGGGFPTQSTFMAPAMEISQYSAVQIATLQAKLNQKLGPEYISTRPGPGGGMKLTYAEGWKIINLANEVFGFNGWFSSITNLTVDFIDTHGENPPRFNIGVHCITRVTLRDGAYHEDVGYGFIDNAKQKGQGLDKCKKEAVTDALKRTLRNFGNLLGNCLYDKSYAEQVTKIKLPPAKKLDPSELHRRPEFDPNLSTASTSTSATAVTTAPAAPTTAPTTIPTSTPAKPRPPPQQPAQPIIKREPQPKPPPPQPVQRIPPPSPDRTIDMFGSDDEAFLAQVDLEEAARYAVEDRPLHEETERSSDGSITAAGDGRQALQPPARPAQPALVERRPVGDTSFRSNVGNAAAQQNGPQQQRPAVPPSRPNAGQPNIAQPQQRPSAPPPNAAQVNNAAAGARPPLPHQAQSNTSIGARPLPQPGAGMPNHPVQGHGPAFGPQRGHAQHQPAQQPPAPTTRQQASPPNRVQPAMAPLQQGMQTAHPAPPQPRSSSVGGFHFPPGANAPMNPAAFNPRPPPQQRPSDAPQAGAQPNLFAQAGIKRRAETMAAGYQPERQAPPAPQAAGQRHVLGDLEVDERGNPKRARH